MGPAEAALGRIAERQEEALVAASEVLQAQIAAGGEVQRLAGEVRHGSVRIAGRVALDEVVGAEQIGDARHGRLVGRRAGRLGRLTARFQQEVDEAVGVVEGRPQHLAAGNVLEGRRDTAGDLHRAGIDRLGGAEARQGGAEGADEEGGLDEIAARLLDGQRRKVAIIERALGHDAVDGEGQLLADLGGRDFRHRRIAAAVVGEEPVGIVDGAFATLDGHIHGSGLHGDAGGPRQGSDALGTGEDEVDAARKEGVVGGKARGDVGGKAGHGEMGMAGNAGPASFSAAPLVRDATCRMSVVERSG